MTATEFYLDLIVEGEAIHRFTLGSGERSVGRGRDCSVRLLDPTVSSLHASIAIFEDPDSLSFWHIRLMDLESTNGTFINGRRIEAEEAFIGDEIHFGDVLLRLCGPEGHVTTQTAYQVPKA